MCVFLSQHPRKCTLLRILFVLRNEDFDQLYNLYLATTSEQDLMDKIKEICCDDSIEEPIKKEVSAVFRLILFSLIFSSVDKILMLKSENSRNVFPMPGLQTCASFVVYVILYASYVHCEYLLQL